MEIKNYAKESLSVIGKEGSKNDGEGFIQQLWENANRHYNEIEPFVKKDGNGNPVGFWGIMIYILRNISNDCIENPGRLIEWE